MRFLIVAAMLAVGCVGTVQAGQCGDVIVRRGLFGRQIVEPPQAAKVVINRAGVCVGGVCNVARRVVVRQAAPVVIEAAPTVVEIQSAPVVVRQQRQRVRVRSRRCGSLLCK